MCLMHQMQPTVGQGLFSVFVHAQSRVSLKLKWNRNWKEKAIVLTKVASVSDNDHRTCLFSFFFIAFLTFSFFALFLISSFFFFSSLQRRQQAVYAQAGHRRVNRSRLRRRAGRHEHVRRGQIRPGGQFGQSQAHRWDGRRTRRRLWTAGRLSRINSKTTRLGISLLHRLVNVKKFFFNFNNFLVTPFSHTEWLFFAHLPFHCAFWFVFVCVFPRHNSTLSFEEVVLWWGLAWCQACLQNICLFKFQKKNLNFEYFFFLVSQTMTPLGKRRMSGWGGGGGGIEVSMVFRHTATILAKQSRWLDWRNRWCLYGGGGGGRFSGLHTHTATML